MPVFACSVTCPSPFSPAFCISISPAVPRRSGFSRSRLLPPVVLDSLHQRDGRVGVAAVLSLGYSLLQVGEHQPDEVLADTRLKLEEFVHEADEVLLRVVALLVGYGFAERERQDIGGRKLEVARYQPPILSSPASTRSGSRPQPPGATDARRAGPDPSPASGLGSGPAVRRHSWAGGAPSF